MTEQRRARSLEREAARLKAKQHLKKHERGQKARRFGKQIAVVGGILALVGIIVGVVVIGGSQISQKPSDYLIANNIRVGANLQAITQNFTPTPTPTPGVTVPANPPHIVIVQDYQCLYCHRFEVANDAQLRQLVSSGQATIEYRPISFLDEMGGSLNGYSKRAANSAYCVATYQPDKFFEWNSYLYANWPEEGTAGPEDKVLLNGMGLEGITVDENMRTCVNTHRFSQWIKDNTDKFYYSGALVPGTKIPFTGTPFVMVNGQQYTAPTSEEYNNPANFAAFVNSFIKK